MDSEIKNPFFSIIIATYNRANFISDAINSVLNQSFQDWECIIVDDGSTDDTKLKLLEFCQRDIRIKYVFQENSERSVARNNGISQSRGKFICFLDSDDIYDIDHLFEFKKLIEDKKEEQALYVSGVSLGKRSLLPQVYKTKVESHLEFMLTNTIGTPRTCLSKPILIKHQFNSKIRIGEDMELWSRVSQEFPVYYHCKKTFIEVEHEERSINSAARLEQLSTIKYIIKNVNPPRRIASSLKANAYFSIAKYHIRKGEKKKGVTFLLKSIVAEIPNNNLHKILLILSLIGLYKNIYKEYGG